MRIVLCIMLCGLFIGGGVRMSDAAIKPDHQAIDVRHYRIAIDLDEHALTFAGTVDITFRATQRLRDVWFHSEELQITHVLHDTTPLDFTQNPRRVQIRLPHALEAGAETTVRLQYTGTANTRAQQGLFVIQSGTRLPSFYTQFESQAARRAFPCFDEPFQKATSDVLLTGNARYTMLSNGTRVGEQHVGKGRKQVHFRNTDPISTYLMTFVAAELDAVESTYRSSKGIIPLTIYVAPGRGDDVGVAMRALRESMAFFEEYFGEPYPWERYGIVAVEGFTWGGMENKGLANFNAHSLYWNADQPYRKQANIVSLVAHELAHEWFGNLVTMQWWHDLWLNEAFATFMEQKVSAQVYGDDVARIANFEWLAKDYFPQDRGALSHPIAVQHAQTVDELFDGITYAKGVQVVQMMEDLVGEENFQRAIQTYMTTFRLRNATTEDFLATIETTAGVSLQDFARSWLHNAGFPVMQVTAAWDDSARQLRVELTQRTPTGGGVRQPFVGVLPLGFFGADYAHQLDVAVLRSHESISVELTAPPHAVSVNRNGHFLAEFVVDDEQSQVSHLLTREDYGVGKVMAVARVIAQTEDPTALIPIIQQSLRDDALAVRQGIVVALLRARKNTAWIRTIARGVQEQLLENLRTNPTEPVAAALQEGCLTLLGEADDPELYGLLHARLGHAVADIQFGAMAGLLRTSEPTRFQSFAEMVSRTVGDSARTMEMLKVLAKTPDPAIFPELTRLLGDAAIVASDDSSTPMRVLRTLRQDNLPVIFTADGINFVAHSVRANLDRPAVAKDALRALEGLRAAPKSVQQQARTALRDILDEHPPELIASIAKQILHAL